MYLKHLAPPGSLVQPTGHPDVVVAAVHPLGLAAWHVRGAHVKKPKKPQDTVHVALHVFPIQGALQCLVARGQHRNLSFSFLNLWRLKQKF